MSKRPCILVMAGGTGGHIFPALAVADALRSQGWRVIWMGAPGSMESELVPKHGYKMALVDFSGVRGKGLMRKLTLPFTLGLALWQSATALWSYRPDVVLGMGGYITFPGGLASKLLGYPLVIHEQNSVAGLSNKKLAGWAKRVLSGFPDVLPNAEWCGNPVRADIAAMPPPQERYAARSGKLNLMVLGGSLGAKAINECVPQALALLPEDIRPDVLHQSGRRHLEAVQAAYQRAGVHAEIMPFLDEMAFFYSQADLVICRSGALTVAELSVAGIASILVPYPSAVDDHQTGNARFLSERGAAVLLPQTEMTPQRLADLLKDISRERALEMAQAARSGARPDAAQRVARICAEVAAKTSDEPEKAAAA
ncbi:MAG: undecaprenyldiphospho-muramoylpentapeptide beta-N-acetylglucosaminyltransferase [Gallionellaceae bacterium]|jgi:UDP-N-acetylglucosamine--N-acetylmuramyl-(pentapeptide) pyrophosphoryl-undecaprenol N-acetylglucosamine transferase|nr:undecaprenyldiphospho-muramoylpentapeptide beta-N-acetylglucosaminyltransferase [Gallionellaceae bacterium]